MRKGHLLFSAIHLLIILALFATAVALFGLHHSPDMRKTFISWIEGHHTHFRSLGGMILILASVLSIGFYSMQRHQFLRISMKNRHIHVDERLVRQSICQFWQEQFPNTTLPSDIYFSRQKIEVITTMPRTEDLELTLEEIETKLGDMLQAKFDYDREFFLTLRLK